MAKENKIEYERVDGKADKYKRILVKFNPKFMRGSDFEIEFIPLDWSVGIGKTLVTEIDTMSTMDLYQWVDRQNNLSSGTEDSERGTIVPIEINQNRAKIATRVLRQGRAIIEPRQIIGRVKRVFEDLVKRSNRPTAFAYNHFLWCGQLGSLPRVNEAFTIENLKKAIEEVPYNCRNANGEVVERPLVDHLFDTHKTEYVEDVILNFLWVMIGAAAEAIEEQQQ